LSGELVFWGPSANNDGVIDIAIKLLALVPAVLVDHDHGLVPPFSESGGA
jgi:hypothetical protein